MFPHHLTSEDAVMDHLSDQTLADLLPSQRVEYDQVSSQYRIVHSSTSWTGRSEVDERHWGFKFAAFGRDPEAYLDYDPRNLHLDERLKTIVLLGFRVTVKLPILLLETCTHIPVSQKSHRQWVLWIYGRRTAWHLYVVIPTRSVPP